MDPSIDCFRFYFAFEQDLGYRKINQREEERRGTEIARV